MAKIAESFAQVADEIVSGRRQRAELAVEINNLTRHRRNEMHSSLARWRASRISAGRAVAAEIDKMTRARHDAVLASLTAMEASRGQAHSEQRSEATDRISRRREEVKSLLMQFGREMGVCRQHRLECAKVQHAGAAAFMRNLTSAVAAMLDGFDKDDRNRALVIRGRLAAYARERRHALAAWSGRLSIAGPSPQSAAAILRPEQPTQALTASPVSANTPKADVAPEMSALSFGWSRPGQAHDGLNERHEGDSK
jgi:hypothetical protein